MNLHENKKLFTDAVLAASEYLDIRPVYIEKDYWITRSLKLMVQNSNAEKAIFKGGTSLSKAYKIGNRFSEDIDIAISDADTLTGNQLKMLIKKIAKEMTSGLEEVVVPGVTSKGSRYYKAMYSYPNVLGKAIKETVNIGQLLVEINSFANPYPYVSKSIDCFIAQFFRQTGNDALVEEYGLQSFILNVLDKRQTLTEKLVSLIRFSLSDNYIYDVNPPSFSLGRWYCKDLWESRSSPLFMKRRVPKGLVFLHIYVSITSSPGKKVWVEKKFIKLRFSNLAIARHYILMQFSTLNCRLLPNEELDIITFSLVKK